MNNHRQNNFKIPQTVLVTGASGYIGGRLITALVSKGFHVKAMVRDRRRLDLRLPKWKNVEVVCGDIFDPESLNSALRDVDVAYYLVHSMTGTRGDFASRDMLGAQNFARACEQCQVGRIIYLGGLGDHQDQLSKHLKSRHETGRALRCTSVPVTELRAAVIVGSGSASFEILRDLVKRLPVMICPRWVMSRCEPIAIRQVLAYMVGCLTEPRTVGETLDIGGGEILTYRQMIKQASQVMGCRTWIINVPVLTPRLSSYWLNLVTSVPFSLARHLVEGLKNDVVCHDHRIRDWISVPKITYRQAVRLALKREKQGQRETRWTDATTAVPTKQIPSENKPYYKDERIFLSDAPVEKLFSVIEQIGGHNGWYYGNWLWRLRGVLDILVGGVGLRRGRNDPGKLAVGEPLDFWRVQEYEPGKRLVLLAEMVLPGVAQLEFIVTPREDKPGSFLVQTARFWPSGILGKLYWYSVLPLHLFVFPGMAGNIKKMAEKKHPGRS